MLNFETDKRNLTAQQLHKRGVDLLEELRAIDEKITKKPESCTNDMTRRIADIGDWLDSNKRHEANQPYNPGGTWDTIPSVT